MENNDIYSAPTAELETKADFNASPRLKAIAIVLSMPICILNFLTQFKQGGLAGGIGGIIGSVLLPLIVVWIFQLSKRLRNSRSRWKIFAWTQAIILAGLLNSVYLATRAAA